MSGFANIHIRSGSCPTPRPEMEQSAGNDRPCHSLRRLYQLHQTQSGMQPPSINSAVSALRFFFTVSARPAGSGAAARRRAAAATHPGGARHHRSVLNQALGCAGRARSAIIRGFLLSPSLQNHPAPTPRRDQFPTDGQLLAAVPRVRSPEAFGRRPSALARVDCSRRAGIRNPNR